MAVVVCGVGDGDILRAADGVLSMLADGAGAVHLRAAIADVREAIASPRTLLRDADRWEDALFGLVEPDALVPEVLGRVRSRPPPAAPESELGASEEPRPRAGGGRKSGREGKRGVVR